jgi:ESCRT-I complex subunit TSG101
MAGVPEKVLNWLYSVLTSVCVNLHVRICSANHEFRNTKTSIAHITTRPRRSPTIRLFPHEQRFTVRHYNIRHCAPQTCDCILTTSAYENGASALLLILSGTLPVTFRGATYGFPVAIWVPYAYPREPPIVYITPSQDMVVRPGQHVSGDGRVYHPYLAQWSQYWDVRMLYAREHATRRIQYKGM